MHDDKGMQHTTEADSSAAAVTGGQVRVDNDCGVKNVYDTSDNRGQCSRAASAPARDVDDDAPMVAWCMLSIVDVVAVPRVDGGSLVLVKGIAPLPWQLVLVFVAAPPMVAWLMLPIENVVTVPRVEGGSVGVAKLWILPDVGTGGHFMVLVIVLMLLGQVKFVAVAKVLAIACALLLKIFVQVAW
ncbi:hypothetical protein PF004_g6853 [Phytophthora fragariae]|uniref:Uncharacterized protein n=1 Tax=Phytophthora fragariae TaxID=53985 RepID=A0A6G0PBL4_9STRA|nr:hypothetical protein PF004_g6853 [Phytophthora fragariae]